MKDKLTTKKTPQNSPKFIKTFKEIENCLNELLHEFDFIEEIANKAIYIVKSAGKPD